jgi:hypothetical protein
MPAGRFSGKTALITGDGTGIGRAAAPGSDPEVAAAVLR